MQDRARLCENPRAAREFDPPTHTLLPQHVGVLNRYALVGVATPTVEETHTVTVGDTLTEPVFPTPSRSSSFTWSSEILPHARVRLNFR